MKTTTVPAELPTQLLTQLQYLIHDGWFEDINDVIVNVLRRFLETHRPELMEHYIREDVEWGLQGKD